MRLVGLRLLLQRPVAHVLHAQGGGDDQHLAQRPALAPFQNHAAHARVQRQARQLQAQFGQFLRLIHRAQFLQELDAIGNRAARGRIEKRKILHPPTLAAQVQALHAQDHGRQRRAQDFRVGKARAAGKVLLVVQPDAHAVAHAPAAAGALVGGGLAHRLDQQLLHLATVAVALDAGRAGVDDVLDARHRERGLGHVGGNDDARRAVRVEHAVLLGLAEAREQRQHLGVARQRAVRQVLAQMLGSVADFAFAGHEDQYVPRWTARPDFIDRFGNRIVQIVVAAFLEGPIALLHRIGAPRHQQHRRGLVLGIGKVLGKTIRVDGGRGDDQLQIGPLRQDLLQIPEQEVDVQAALVRLVDDERVVGAQQRVGLRFGQQDAVGHQLHAGAGRQPVVEAHLVAHHLAQRRLQLVGNALGHAGGGDAARLRVADQLAALAGRCVAAPAAHGQRDLGQLRGLARTRFAADDDDLVRAQRGLDLGAPAAHGQRLGEVDQLGLVGRCNFRTARALRQRLAGRCGGGTAARVGHGVRHYPRRPCGAAGGGTCPT